MHACLFMEINMITEIGYEGISSLSSHLSVRNIPAGVRKSFLDLHNRFNHKVLDSIIHAN